MRCPHCGEPAVWERTMGALFGYVCWGCQRVRLSTGQWCKKLPYPCDKRAT